MFVLYNFFLFLLLVFDDRLFVFLMQSIDVVVMENVMSKGKLKVSSNEAMLNRYYCERAQRRAG